MSVLDDVLRQHRERKEKVSQASQAAPRETKSGGEGKKKDKKKSSDSRRNAQKLKFVHAKAKDPASLEWLSERRILADPVKKQMTEAELRSAADAGRRRLEAGHKLRGMVEDARLSGFKSLDMESVGGGSFGSGIPLGVTAAIEELDELRSEMPVDLYQLAEGIVSRDTKPWERFEGAERADCYERVRLAFDYIALRKGLVSADIFALRWPEAPVLNERWRRVAQRVRERQAEEDLALLIIKSGASFRRATGHRWMVSHPERGELWLQGKSAPEALKEVKAWLGIR